MNTNLAGLVAITPLSRQKGLFPLFEAVVNSIDAIRELEDQQGAYVNITVQRNHSQNTLIEDVAPQVPPVLNLIIRDNGAGFIDESFRSFNEAASVRKALRGGKGVGRFLWLKTFRETEIESVYIEGGECFKRTFRFNTELDVHAHKLERVDPSTPRCTTVRLCGYKRPYSDTRYTLDQIAQRLIEHCLPILIESNCPRIRIQDGENEFDLKSYFELVRTGSHHTLTIGDETFQVLGLKLRGPVGWPHCILYAGDSRGVKRENLDNYIPNMRKKLHDDENDARGFTYTSVVQSSYLDQNLSQMRGEFTLSDDQSSADSLFPQITLEQIRGRVIPLVQKDLQPLLEKINKNKAEELRHHVETVDPLYRPILGRVDIDRLPPSPTPTQIDEFLRSELHTLDMTSREEGKTILNEEPWASDYSARLEEFLQKHSEIGLIQLAKHVTHRKVVLELFRKAIQIKKDGTGSFQLEKVVHQIVFPMRSTSETVRYEDQNLWIIDERLNYHSLLDSDMALSRNSEIGVKSRKRPDILGVFDRRIPFVEGDSPFTSIIIVEFKQPGRVNYAKTENPIQEVIDQVKDIRSGKYKGVGGRQIPLAASETTPAYAYIICDIVPAIQSFAKDREFTPTSDGIGLYRYISSHGLYIEILGYEKVVADAEKRNRVLFDKLRLA